MTFHVVPATIEEKLVILALIQPYLEELSRFPDIEPLHKDENGVYQYSYLDAYWEEKERFPYLLHSDGKIAGFALVRVRVEVDGRWEMAEFYLLPQFRRRGLAMSCVADIFEKHPGEWTIMFNKHNLPGRALWRKVAEHFAKGDIKTEQDPSHDYLLFTV